MHSVSIVCTYKLQVHRVLYNTYKSSRESQRNDNISPHGWHMKFYALWIIIII